MISLFDGAMGTMLQEAGLPAGYCPELWNVEHPSDVTAIHRAYVAAGADIIETNTFGANRIKLAYYGLDDKVAALNTAAVRAARAAGGKTVRVAGSMGPTGKFIVPLGDLGFDDAYSVFLEQARALDRAGVDFILIETIIDIQEMRAALLAAKAATDKPVICQLSFGADGRTVTGTDPATAAILLDAMGADVIGANCSLGPEQLVEVIRKFASHTNKPLSVQPNAGMPRLENGCTVFPMDATAFGRWAAALVSAGATYIGGCCGTTPAHIKAVRHNIKTLPHGTVRPALAPVTALTSRSRTVFVGPGFPTAVIGERINPTGRKSLAADIRTGEFLLVKKEALGQAKAGAAILDVNMGVPDIDQAAAMQRAVQELSMLVKLPLSIDTTDAAALEAGLRFFPGRALVNSVSAEPDRLEKFLPLAKKYGAVVLCLPLAPDGVPATAEERLAVISRITAAAMEAGLRPQDMMLDALVLTLAADPQAAREILTTLRLYRKQFGYPAAMGLSNISYGLPCRSLVNSALGAMALEAGLDAPILNPYDELLGGIMSAAEALIGLDAGAAAYSRRHASGSGGALPAISPVVAGNTIAQIRQMVVDGGREAVVPLINQAVSEGCSALSITDEALTVAMEVVGRDFASGRCFLPQVMLAAETVRAAFDELKKLLPASEAVSRGTVVLATVKGDIHDLGKNIVAALLANNEFTVVDLGKDVTAEDIVAAAAEHQADLVGLCALMTTTMPQIDKAIKALKTSGSRAQILVGGAVLTPEYAAKAGADAYASDGIDAVNQAKRLLEAVDNA